MSFSLLEMNTISNDYFQNSSFYDSSYNEETFSSYNHFLDGEDSSQDVNDTSSILITSHIFNSSQVNTRRKFDLFENFQFNQPIYDDFYDYKLEQIGCDFADLIQENFSKEKIVQEEALDSYNTDVDFLSNNHFHYINFSNSLRHSFDFHCTYHDWVVDWLEKYFLPRFHHYGKTLFSLFVYKNGKVPFSLFVHKFHLIFFNSFFFHFYLQAFISCFLIIHFFLFVGFHMLSWLHWKFDYT